MKCAHPECDCIEPAFPFNGEFYCDAACAASAADGDERCGCRHASCEGADATGEPAEDAVEDDAAPKPAHVRRQPGAPSART